MTLSFEEFAYEVASADKTPVKEKFTYERQKLFKYAGRNKLPENLPVVEEIIEPEDVTVDVVKISMEITEIREFSSANFYIRKAIRSEYVSKKTQEIKIA